MFSKAINTLAKAKLIRNAKNKELYKLVVAFNVYETKQQFNRTVHKFPVQKKCDYVSGDLLITDVAQALTQAQKTLRTNNIILVG